MKVNHNPQNLIAIEEAIQLEDLSLPDEQAETTKAGEGLCHGVSVLAWARVNGVS